MGMKIRQNPSKTWEIYLFPVNGQKEAVSAILNAPDMTKRAKSRSDGWKLAGCEVAGMIPRK
jgi:hypothetical protein